MIDIDVFIKADRNRTCIKTLVVLLVFCLLNLFMTACTNAEPMVIPNPEESIKETKPDVNKELPALKFTILIHLEAWKLDKINPQGKLNHEAYLDEVKAMVELLNKYNAIFTWESGYLQFLKNGQPNNPDGVFDPAHPNFIDTPLFKYLKNNKQDIGVHADLGGNSAIAYTQLNFVQDLQRMKTNMNLRSGISRHVSGICSHLDWVNAAVDTGYLFTTSNVAYCTAAMAEEDKPTEYKDCTSAGGCHQIYPEDITRRIHPWRMKDAASWLTDDATGDLVMLPSSSPINCLEENQTTTDSLTLCSFDKNDLTELKTDLDLALANRDANKVNMYYGVFSVGTRLDLNMLEDLLKTIQVYVDDGDIEWSSVNKIYDAYVDWEKDNR